METWQAILLFGSIVAFIAIMKYIFNEKNKIYRKINSHKNSLIKGAFPGQEIRIKGTIVSTGASLNSPLNKIECQHYKVIVDQLVSSGKSQHFKNVLNDEEKTSYLIKQDNSYAFIRSNNLKSYIETKTYSNYGVFNKNKVDFSDYLILKSVKLDGFFGSKNKFRFKEGVLVENSEITVLGKGSFKDAEQLGFDSSYGRILLIEPLDDSYVYLSNDKRLIKNKEFNPAEYQRIS